MTSKKVKRLVNNKSGVSQRKLAHKLNVSQSTIHRSIKRTGIFYRKKKRAPKATEGQKQRQIERLEILCAEDGMFSYGDQRDIVIDDESYFTLSGAGMPGNSGF